MNLISRESLTVKSCTALHVPFSAKRASVRRSTTPAPFTIMKLQPLTMIVPTVATAQHDDQ